MSRHGLSAEAKSTLTANLELELNARKEKLIAMCEAQVASLRSRLERRVNRVPAGKRNTKIIELIDASLPAKPAAAKKEITASANSRRPRPAPAPVPTPVPASAPAPATAPAPISAPKAPARKASAPKASAPKATATKTAVVKPPVSKPTRGLKRNSDDMSTEDKENNAELTIPKKRVKAATATTAARTTTTITATTTTRLTRTTRAASKKVDAVPQVLSPKNSNPRAAPQTRARRAR